MTPNPAAAPTPTVEGTEPYPWPYDGLDPTRLALVLAGWDAHWAARAHDALTVTTRVEALGLAVAAAGGQVVRISHALPPRAPAGAPEPTPLLAPPGPGLHAEGVDAFYGSGLDAWLRTHGCTQLLVAGHGLEGPVHSTLRSANDRGLECLLVTDAASPLAPELVAGALSSVCMSGGIFGAVGASSAVLAALAAAAATPVVAASAAADPPTPIEEEP